MSDDRYADASRDGSDRLEIKDVGTVQDFSFTTIEEECYSNGWNRIQRPVGGDPLPVSTSGMRGEPGDFDTASRDGSTEDLY